MTVQTTQTQDDTKQVVLSQTETGEIEKVFEEARDFRSVWEKITAPIDNIISQSAKVIDKDPIMNVSGELEKMNSDVQSVYKEILDNDGTFMKLLKTIPIIWGIASKVDGKLDEAKFNMKTVEGKIEVIFSGFDQAYTSLNTSIDMQNDFIDGIDANLGKIVAYKDFLTGKIEELKVKADSATDADQKRKFTLFIQNVEFFQSNLIVLIGNLEMAKKRLEMRLDSATKLSLAMNSSRPIFKTLLSSALLETSSQKAIDASMKTMQIMAKTIDQMSSELTDKAIEGSKRAEEIASKPVLSNQVFLDNVTKLKNHFDEIDTFRERVAKEAQAERKLFEEAKLKLADMKVMGKEGNKELAWELM